MKLALAKIIQHQLVIGEWMKEYGALVEWYW